MRRVIDSDRGPAYSLLCVAVAFGISIGCVFFPVMALSLWAAGWVYYGLSFVMWAEAALCIALSVFYAGAYAGAIIANLLVEPIMYAIYPVTSVVACAVTNVTSYIYSWFWTTEVSDA